MSNIAKKVAAAAALELVQNGMSLGIGTGSTAEFFIHLLAEKVASGLSITGVPTSEKTATLCTELGIPLTDLTETPILDLAIDGTDEFDGSLNLIKGGGGALLREKIVATAAKQFVVIADASKQVAVLGAFPLPVEIISMAEKPLTRQIENLGAEINLRKTISNQIFCTDENHWILDCAFGASITHPLELAQKLSMLPGVVEHGLFCSMPERIFLGFDDQILVIKGKQKN